VIAKMNGALDLEHARRVLDGDVDATDDARSAVSTTPLAASD
jgi:hypothetical protein